MKNDTKQARGRRRVWRWLGYGALGVVGVAALAAAGGAWWLWGWRVGTLHFHESWTPEQRADLQEMADAIKTLVDDVARTQEAHGDFFIGPTTRLGLEIDMRTELARCYAELRRTAAEGKAPEHDPVALPMTALAARLGKLSLARELVSRGDDPNNALHTESLMGTGVVNESSFQSAIACTPLWIREEQPPPTPVAERQALLEHMLAHGATLTIPQPEGGLEARHVTIVIAIISALRGDEGAMMEWLLAKGFAPLSAEDRKDITMLGIGEGTLPAMRRIVSTYYGELSEADRYWLLHNSILDQVDAPQKLRWALEELHADPNATLCDCDEEEPHDAEPENAMRYFNGRILWQLRTATSPEPDTPKELSPRQMLEMLDLLLTHGGKLEHPEWHMPTEPTLRQEYIEVINKHNIPLPDPTE